MFAGAVCAYYVSDLLFSRLKSYDWAWDVFQYANAILRKIICVARPGWYSRGNYRSCDFFVRWHASMNGSSCSLD